MRQRGRGGRRPRTHRVWLEALASTVAYHTLTKLQLKGIKRHLYIYICVANILSTSDLSGKMNPICSSRIQHPQMWRNPCLFLYPLPLKRKPHGAVFNPSAALAEGWLCMEIVRTLLKLFAECASNLQVLCCQLEKVLCCSAWLLWTCWLRCETAH